MDADSARERAIKKEQQQLGEALEKAKRSIDAHNKKMASKLATALRGNKQIRDVNKSGCYYCEATNKSTD